MKKTLFIVLMLVISVAPYVFAHGPEEGYQMGPWMMWGGHGFSWVWSIFMLIIPITFIVGIIFLIRWIIVSADKSKSGPKQESAIDILNRRYANSEIDKEEYEQKKKDLSG